MLLMLIACSSENEEQTLMQRADIYVNSMEFHNSLGQIMLYYAILEENGFTQILFVHSEEEFLAGDFPDDAVIAWPSLFSYLMLDGLNAWIRENEKEVAIEAYSLFYPLTKEDIVNRWEEILKVWLNYRLGGFLYPRAGYEFSRLLQSERAILRDAFTAAGVDVTEYGARGPGDTSSRNPETNRIIIFELYDKLDEDVQIRLLTEIPHFMALYRDEQRRRAIGDARRLAEQEAYEIEE